MVCHYIFCPLVVCSLYSRKNEILCDIPVDVMHVCPFVYIHFCPASNSGHDTWMKTGISLHMYIHQWHNEQQYNTKLLILPLCFLQHGLYLSVYFYFYRLEVQSPFFRCFRYSRRTCSCNIGGRHLWIYWISI